MPVSSEDCGWIYLVKLQTFTWVTTARTIHLPEQKETIHLISMLRKAACSGSIHDLAHIPTQNCLSDCLTKASAKADNLITAVKTGRLLDVEIHPNFGTVMERGAFLSTWCRTFTHTQKRNMFLAPTLQEGPFHVMLVETNHTQEQKKQKVCDWNHFVVKRHCAS